MTYWMTMGLQSTLILFLWLHWRAGLLQGLKNETSLAQFKNETKVLNSFRATNYMFLHWDGGVESSKGDYKSHNFVKSRPGLALAIESIGNYFARRILLNPKLGGKLQPGLLCNNPTITKGAWVPTTPLGFYRLEKDKIGGYALGGTHPTMQ
jgi:hypothetical protein